MVLVVLGVVFLAPVAAVALPLLLAVLKPPPGPPKPLPGPPKPPPGPPPYTLLDPPRLLTVLRSVAQSYLLPKLGMQIAFFSFFDPDRGLQTFPAGYIHSFRR